MNRVGELLEQRGMSQKELAISMGIAQPSISAWVTQKADPARRNLKRLCEIFNVDRRYLLCEDEKWDVEYPEGIALRRVATPSKGYSSEPRKTYSGLTDEDLARIASLVSVSGDAPRTIEARVLAAGVDRMPAEERERALKVMQLIFAKYAKYFEEGATPDDTEL